MEEPLYTNKLITEKSPYLLSYAHTPVNWFPWCKEAFELAKSKDRPIFLSIGGTNSRWCRVMLKESYGDIEIARILNDHFVCIKVDKEELPHIADLYFELTKMLSVSAASAGIEMPSWPLNVFLSPDLVPFFSVNYLSKEERFGFPSFLQILEKIHRAWEEIEDREILVNQGQKVVEVIAFLESCRRLETLDENVLKEMVNHIYEEVDPRFGALKTFPKKLSGLLGRFLLRFGVDRQENRCLFVVDRMLSMMALGGILDHIGGGFYSYSIDDKWLIPSFEKKLIDNLFTALLYLEVGVLLDKIDYVDLAENTFSYIVDNLYVKEHGCFQTSEDGGGFGSKEGNYYTWSLEEIKNALGDDADLFCECYGVCREGFCNGRNIPHIPLHFHFSDVLNKYRMTEEELQDKLATLKETLKKVREQRAKPFKDDLVLTCGNGLAIYTFVQAGLLLNKSEYLDIAEKCGEFLLTKMWRNPVLLRRWRDGESKYNGGLEDYGATILASLSLFQSGRGCKWLEFAETLLDELILSFKSEGGGFYTTDGRDEDIILKQSSLADKEEISGNALVAESLLSFYFITGKKEYLLLVEEILQSVQSFWRGNRLSTFSLMTIAERYHCKRDIKIVVTTSKDLEERGKILSCFEGVFIPDKTILWVFEEERESLSKFLPKEELRVLSFSGKTVIRVFEPKCCHIFQDLRKFQEYLRQIS